MLESPIQSDTRTHLPPRSPAITGAKSLMMSEQERERGKSVDSNLHYKMWSESKQEVLMMVVGGGAFKSIDSYKEQEQDHKIKKSAEKLKTSSSSSNVGKNKNQLKVQCLKVIQWRFQIQWLHHVALAGLNALHCVISYIRTLQALHISCVHHPVSFSSFPEESSEIQRFALPVLKLRTRARASTRVSKQAEMLPTALWVTGWTL